MRCMVLLARRASARACGRARCWGCWMPAFRGTRRRSRSTHRIFLHELGPARHHATVILRPWTISGGVDERMPDPAGAELQSFWRAGQEGIDLPIDKQSPRIGLRIIHPVDVLVRIKTDELCHQSFCRTQACFILRRIAQRCCSYLFPTHEESRLEVYSAIIFEFELHTPHSQKSSHNPLLLPQFRK
jgi:hypothetical protein